jgi:hypothetical protein
VVDYAKYTSDPFQPMNQGLASLGQSMRQARFDESAMADATQGRTLRDLQIADGQGKQGALMAQYGTSDLAGAYAAQGAEHQKAEAAKGAFTRAKEMLGMGVEPQSALDFYNQATGSKLTYQGGKDDFLQIKDEVSGKQNLYNWRTGEMKEIYQGTPKAEPSQYKDRTRPEGTGTVFEESQDGGKTWKEKSRGAKGAGGHGSGGGVPEAEEVASWADAVQSGRATLSDIPSRGSIRTQVVRMIEKRGGTDYAGSKAENSAYSSSLTQQQKQAGSMGSFVRNLNSQIDRVGQIGAELYTADARLLNIPIRAIRSKIMGSANQAKYDMYLAEIESEIGKLSTGSTGSVAELSQGAQERWAKIHDKNLSLKDMLQLLKETKHAGELRMKSVKDQIEETRSERKSKVGSGGPRKVGKYTVEVH